MRYILVLVLGLVIGGGAAIYLLGVPSAKAIPGTVVQAPSDGQPAPVMVSISEKFFDEMLAHDLPGSWSTGISTRECRRAGLSNNYSRSLSRRMHQQRDARA